ncbi:MAG TPA: CHAD domain-containing protein, partial [Longimicrobiales bacterium]|nr:CHAD domain-containing protein [Longimicrobiales bacterium]
SAAERAGVWFLREELERREEAGYAALLGTASREQVNIDRRLRRRLTELDTAIRTAGGGYGPRFRTALRAALADRGGDLEGRLAAIRAASDDREAHAARIRAKRVRYLLEPVAAELVGAAGLIARLQQLQDLLGDLHDAHLLGAVIREISATATARGDPAALRPGLDLAARRLAEHRDDLFDGLRGSWLEGEAAPFFGDMKDLLDRLGDSGETDIELERKYLLSRLPPEAPEHPRREIEQGYLPGTRLRERVRRIREGGAERYVRCVKLGSGVRRIEVQEEAGRDVFEGLWPLTEGRRVAKIRYRVADGDLLWEIDRFTDRDLVLAEVELPSEDVRPELPGWLAPYVVREVTGEPEYLNVNLAR